MASELKVEKIGLIGLQQDESQPPSIAIAKTIRTLNLSLAERAAINRICPVECRVLTEVTTAIPYETIENCNSRLRSLSDVNFPNYDLRSG
ncbi:hypothetical protein H6G89_07300 [Oscillatoria sp. FACHB-1407]|uniref:hypothetical protein n=1 Tax=Oscillatoria sp. FACHB-1407 TaxID=2692847 RepID=UPI00168240C7|nr:hypothetical protein [Oscillatoria sp. FACHB-1407]MBD2460848.1 hypothetical protein [Oscillatoria sp. FACHB-1407]